MDKPTKPSNLMPRSFGGVKNNFSVSLQSSGYEDGVPAVYGGDNVNYQLDATGKELDYCEKIVDFIVDMPIGKTITVDGNNKIVYQDLGANTDLSNLTTTGKAKIAIKEYLISETYELNDVVMSIVDGEVKLFKSLVSENIGNLLTDTTKWEEVQLGGSSFKIGQIIKSTTPQIDAGLHLLDGSLLQYGSYKDVIDYYGDLYDSGNYLAIFDTEANWQASVTSYGVCGKFVYDSINKTLRIPKITGFIEGTNTLAELGDVTEAGLPNIIGQHDTNGTGATGAFVSGDTGAYALNAWGNTITKTKIDASLSNTIYGNSNTVQPQSIKVLYYIVIATTTKTDIEVDIDEIATDLNGKADIDLSNVNATGTSKVAGWSMPSSTSEDVTLGANGATYTAPANGWFTLVGYNGSAGSTTLYNTTSSVIFTTGSPTSDYYAELSVPCAKNDVIQLSWHNGNLSIPADGWFKFVYAKGSESEA